jgi:hypothetical protein
VPNNLKHLAEELKGARDLAASRTIKTEEGRELILRLVRVLEILVEGEAKTLAPTRHHQ